jgi:hypothetical protein
MEKSDEEGGAMNLIPWLGLTALGLSKGPVMGL